MAKKFKAKKPERYQAIGFRPSKKLVVAFAILISVGLVGSTLVSAIFAMPNLFGGGGGQRTYEAVISDYKSSLEKNPEDVSLRTQLGHTTFEYGNSLWSRAMQDYIDASTSNNNAKRQSAEEALKKAEKWLKDAEVEYKAVLEKDANNIAVLGNLASIYYYTDRVDLAIETANKGLEVNPDFHVLRFNLGAQFLASGKEDYTAAIKELEKIPSTATNYKDAQDVIKNIEGFLLNK